MHGLEGLEGRVRACCFETEPVGFSNEARGLDFSLLSPLKHHHGLAFLLFPVFPPLDSWRTPIQRVNHMHGGQRLDMRNTLLRGGGMQQLMDQ